MGCCYREKPCTSIGGEILGERQRMPLLQVRVQQEILDELAGLLPQIQRHPNFRAGVVTMQDVTRLAISRGIEALKRELEESR